MKVNQPTSVYKQIVSAVDTGKRDSLPVESIELTLDEAATLAAELKTRNLVDAEFDAVEFVEGVEVYGVLVLTTVAE